eukprot:CAMPEP_0172579208 /NCGR_PEP_ID=MMETSP1067-20121228/139126_1 /TAXON_ID=265564 ORGANISM="Thalassiosira punctigera, Strain Tpunct2005C2" /NCGR_SAMPLE_ID=MMETSP1067 /ASSEMBLY_ACC=CAM_ASM_000444 /LENGTH=141 /DNA_ID=CAMNT_0013371917 /DNA_START=192 /DNA_END=618 /DNA_ORIENTATION=+
MLPKDFVSAKPDFGHVWPAQPNSFTRLHSTVAIIALPHVSGMEGGGVHFLVHAHKVSASPGHDGISDESITPLSAMQVEKHSSMLLGGGVHFLVHAHKVSASPGHDGISDESITPLSAMQVEKHSSMLLRSSSQYASTAMN